jgi:hypothetical protein
MGPFSFSSITTFEKCPKKYHHTKVLKDFEDKSGPEANYGTDFHAAAEHFTRDDVPMPGRFRAMEPMVKHLKALPGDKYAELKVGVKIVDGEFVPCDFDDPDAWYRGIIDLLVVNKTAGRMVDWKTGKNSAYADMRQMDMLAGAVFVLFPELVTISSALIYVVADDLIPKRHDRERLATYLGVFNEQLMNLTVAHQTGVWNPKPSPLCPWCPVTTCTHWRPRKS